MPSLLIVSKDPEWRVLKALGGVIKHHPHTQIKVTDSLSTLAEEKADAVLALGAETISQAHDMGWLPKNKKSVSGLRKQEWLLNGTNTLFSYNVGISEVEYGNYVDLLTDTALALRLAEEGTIEPGYGKYEYRVSLLEMYLEITHLVELGQIVDLSFDTETLGLDPYNPNGYIVSLQFSWKAGHAVVIPFHSKETSEQWLWDFPNQQMLSALLTNEGIKTSGANLKYDLGWLWQKTGIECTNFTFDTTLVGSILDENRSNSLNMHAKIYTGMGGYDDLFDAKADKSRMDLEMAKDPEGFLKYSGGDADAALQVKHAQKEELIQDPALTGFYVNLLHPAVRAFEHVERNGVCVDMAAYKELEADLKIEMNAKIKEAQKIIGGILVAKHWDASKEGGLNLTKASLITDFMFSPHGLNLKPQMVTEKDKKPSTSMDHLLMFEEVPEAAAFVALMKDYSAAAKTLNTYVHGFQEHLRADGRFHPTNFLFAGNKDDGDGGTNTGRISVKDPAFQTIPKHTKWGKRLRRVFCAPQGYLVLETDYSQGELRVVACIAHENAMIKAYMDGKDLHVVTGGNVAGFSYDEMLALKVSDKKKFDALRQLAKAGNFGLLYGMGAEGFQAYAKANYGVAISLAEAEEFRAQFFNTYPGLVSYHTQYKAYAKKHGYVRSPLGRLRHLPLINSPLSQIRSKAERQSINSPVQGCLSDMMLWAIALHHEYGYHREAPCFGAIHDAGYYYVPEDKAVDYAKAVVDTMENLPFEKLGWKPQLKFFADAKLGPNMGELVELKDFVPYPPEDEPGQLIELLA